MNCGGVVPTIWCGIAAASADLGLGIAPRGRLGTVYLLEDCVPVRAPHLKRQCRDVCQLSIRRCEPAHTQEKNCHFLMKRPVRTGKAKHQEYTSAYEWTIDGVEVITPLQRR